MRLLIAVVFISLLSGCESVPLGNVSQAEADKSDNEARTTLDGQHAPIPYNSTKTPKGPLPAISNKELPESVARDRWQTDRNRLRSCVQQVVTLVKDLKVRNIIPDHEASDETSGT